MNTKAKGTGAERELIHLFWRNSWAAVRVAGSGSMKYPSPDILASNNMRKIGLECKAVKSSSHYFSKHEVEELKEFCAMFGAEPWVGVRFGRDWYFLSLEDLKETGKSFAVDSSIAKLKGLSFNELIGSI
jgi:holliday junction resolvase Hjr